MSRLTILTLALVAMAAVPAMAQKPEANSFTPKVGVASSEIQATPEMWFYEQYQADYRDPQLAVRRKAEFRSQQRQHRLASMKWFGFSNQRPITATDPYNGDYAPKWTSNNTTYPNRWTGVGRATVVLQPTQTKTY